MKKIMILASFVFSASLMAQNLDPTVEVSREYQGKIMEVHKPALEMSVPDTLHRFDLEFDYSVFENPYRGSYEFSPYFMEMRPSPSVGTRKTFYLRAGAGYTLYPTLDVLWSPFKKNAFSMDLYAVHRSYIGEYRPVGQQPAWNGYDMLTKVGADFGYDWKKAVIDFGASYYGVADKDYRRCRSYNALDAYVALKSKSVWSKSFVYDVSLKYRLGEDSYAHLNEHDLRVDATFGPEFDKRGKVLFDIGAELVSYDDAMTSTAGRFCIIPRYLYEKGVLELDLGVRLSAIASSGPSFRTRGQVVYPDIHMGLAVIPKALRLYAHIGGGERLETYSDLLARNHHLDLGYGIGGASPLMDVTVERISAVLGLSGRITNFFSYDLCAGYVNYKNALLDAAIETEGGLVIPVVGYSPYQKTYASLDCSLGLQNFRVDGNVRYVHTSGIDGDHMLAPSSFDGNMAIVYDWKKRISVGLDCDFASERKSVSGFVMPWYADLGVNAEYAVNRKLSFWLRGGNLLNMEIQRNLFFAEKGINFTAGICLSI